MMLDVTVSPLQQTEWWSGLFAAISQSIAWVLILLHTVVFYKFSDLTEKVIITHCIQSLRDISL